MSRKPRARRRRAFAALAAVAALGLASTALPRGEATDPEPREWRELPEDLVAVLEAKARQYSSRAREFTCIERIRRAEYDDRDASETRFKEFEYLLIADDNRPGGYAALRSRPGSKGRDEERPDVDWPEPMLWSQVFDRALRSTMLFDVGPLYTTPYKLALPVSWVSSAPVLERTRITEWSGTAEIEYRTGNLISISAEPNLQEELILAEMRRYLSSFRLLGFSLAPAPLGRELTVRFDFEHDGLTYPSRVEIRTFRQEWRDRRTTVLRQRIDYSEYRFFATGTEEKIPPLLYVPAGETEATR